VEIPQKGGNLEIWRMWKILGKSGENSKIRGNPGKFRENRKIRKNLGKSGYGDTMTNLVSIPYPE